MATTIHQLKSEKSQTYLAVLTGATTLVAAIALSLELTSTLEAVSFITGALCVWLVVRENVWNFPIGLLNVATFSIVFFQARLFADAGLQVVYFVLGILGWRLWLRGGENHTQLSLSRIGRVESAGLGLFVFVSTLCLWLTLHHLGGSASFWDALTTSLSLASQWMLNRKQLENWLGWIVVDTIYIPLYVSKGLYLTAILYAIFLCMAIIGWKQWHRSWNVASELPNKGTA
ncbi:MAG: nicotinamide mononucleotide transporter [Pirellulaceae bacterium]|nr:nicotinamide mononucleotide transporter [Pirellulaceae bacterium]